MKEFSDEEMDIMDILYFVSSYKDIIKRAVIDEQAVCKCLQSLLKRAFIYQMAYDKSSFDYEIVEAIDYGSLDKFSYLASKEGMIRFNNLG